MRNYKEQIEQYGINVLKLTEDQLQEFAEDVLPVVIDLLAAASIVTDTPTDAVGLSEMTMRYDNPTRYLCMELLLIKSTETEDMRLEIGHGELYTEEAFLEITEGIYNKKQKEL